jgi:hypothetical protein
MKCLVCDESDGARHYGSVCCSGCKGFFRRSVRFNKVYDCPYGRKCVIEKEYRNCCRSCRYDKCIQVGLNPLLVHGDRGYAKNRSPGLPDNPEEQKATTSAESCTEIAYKEQKLEIDAIRKPQRVDICSDSLQQLLLQGTRIRPKGHEDLPLGITQFIPRYSSDDSASIAKYYIYVERLCDTFVDHTPNMNAFNVDVPFGLAAQRPGSISPRIPMDWHGSELVTSSSFRNNYLRILVHYFDWASHIPELDLLSAGDRELMLMYRCIPCCWMLMGHRSAVLGINGFTCGAGRYFPAGKEQAKLDPEFHSMTVVCDAAVTDLIQPMQNIAISEAEYAMLKVLCFFMPAPRMTEEGISVVLEAREKYLNAFNDLVRLSLPEATFSQVVHRIGRLLILLPVAERVGQLDDETIGMMSLFNYAELRGTLTWELHMKKNLG